MATSDEMLARLAAIPNLTASAGVPLARYTRFALGGPAEVYAETGDEAALVSAVAAVRAVGIEPLVIGGGTNLIVSDEGVRGAVLRYQGDSLCGDGDRVVAGAGAVLQDLVDFTIGRGLRGLETLSGIPGWVGAAVYGNAGAYGRSISESIREVRFFDGTTVQALDQSGCEFAYRESIFKRNKRWIILSVELRLAHGDRPELRRTADDILATRNEKFPATMKCAGSIFKNLLLRELPSAVVAAIPERVVREGKVPAAHFLEQVGAKGMQRGDIHVATYHANLIYNGGEGTARDLRGLIAELKSNVRARFGIELEEEVQYVGFPEA